MLNAKLKNINECSSKSKVHKMYFLRASASQKGLKGKKYETLSSSSKNFERDTYKLFRLVFKSRICSFQSFLACRGSQKLHFVDLGLT